MPALDDVQKYKWEFFGVAGIPLYLSIYPPMYTAGDIDRYGLPVDVLCVGEQKRTLWFMRADQLEALAEHVLPNLLEKQWRWYDQCTQELGKFQVFNQEFLKTDLQGLSNKQLASLVRLYREHFLPPFITNNIIEAVSYYFQHRLKVLLAREGIAEDEASTLMDQYGQSARPSYVKLCASEYRAAANDEQREEIRKKYYYIFNDYVGEKEVTHEELRKLAESTQQAVAEELHTEGISPEAQRLLTVMQVVATMQDIRKAELLEMVSAAKRFALAIAERKQAAFEDLEWATWDEIEKGKWDSDALQMRKQQYVMYWKSRDFFEYDAESSMRIGNAIKKRVLTTDMQASEIKGICASKGTVRGRVAVVLDTTEFGKVQPGDILVTMMTRPEFLPVMHRVAAFVCDEGGLTSHAAIVAREMKKPCVIATKTGTRFFKDGDMVEVDAERGIVRKLDQ